MLLRVLSRRQRVCRTLEENKREQEARRGRMVRRRRCRCRSRRSITILTAVSPLSSLPVCTRSYRPAPMRCRACAHNCPRTSSVLRPPVRFTLRSAHAAARPLDENDSASSGSGSVANSESTAAAQRPVDPPRRVRRSGMDPLPGYQFPQTGKQGGSPDPYEILALDRHATDKDIKRRCELCSLP